MYVHIKRLRVKKNFNSVCFIHRELIYFYRQFNLLNFNIILIIFVNVCKCEDPGEKTAPFHEYF